MKKITFLLMLLLTAFSMNAQTITTEGVEAGTQGTYSSYFGYRAGKVSTGVSNTFIGTNAGRINTSGKSNTLIGVNSGYVTKSGHYNVFVGNATGRFNVGGDRNTYIGYQAGYKNKVNGNVFLGYQAGYDELGSNKLYIDNSSTTTPLIYGDFATDELTINGNVRWGAGGWLKRDQGGSIELGGAANATPYVDFINDTGIGYDMRIIMANENTLVISGNNAGENQLVVEGKIGAQKIKVSATGWADYVFDEDYDLNTIEEVENYVEENNHLPNVPSTDEVLEEGIDVAEMDATLLRQIEELWLHVIELKKEITQLDAQLKAQPEQK